MLLIAKHNELPSLSALCDLSVCDRSSCGAIESFSHSFGRLWAKFALDQGVGGVLLLPLRGVYAVKGYWLPTVAEFE